MDPLIEHHLGVTRRTLFESSAYGLGGAALSWMLNRDGLAIDSAPVVRAGAVGSSTQSLPELPHFAPKAKRIIYLFQNGGPSHVELFDYKPKLRELHGQVMPEEYLKGRRFSSMSANLTGRLVLGHVEPFQQYGKSGAWMSDLMPFTAQIADELCFVKGMQTDAVNHAPAISFLLSGGQLPGRPTMGSWLSYGLGSANEDLPSYVVMTSVSKGTSCGQIFYDFYWGSGFLPSRYQGVKFRGSNEPVLYLQNPDGMTRDVRRGMLDDIQAANQLKLESAGDPEIATRIAQYEMAYRMQASVPELTDLSNEPKSVLERYGPQVTEPGTFAHNCLMARRMIERGVQFVQLMHAGWDQHNSLTTELYTQCKDTDQPSAALVADLKERGLLEDTLVIWGGEFGRTPFIQGDIQNRKRWGRDHHPYAFTVWMAGGGVKPGISYGESDELAVNAVKDAVHVHDLQATILHLMGIDHEKLTYRFQGRQFRLTDVHGKIVKGILT